MDNTLEYPSPTQFASVQVPSSRKLPSTPLAPSKNQTSLPHRPLPLARRKSRVRLRNSPFSESSPSSSEETSSASQKNPFSRPVPEAVSSHGKSAVPTDSPLSSAGETSGNERVGPSKKSSSHVIDPELLAEQESLTAKVQDFQEGVRTRMKQKYARNQKLITFEPDDIVTLRIPKEDRAATDNHRVVVMVKSIPHEGRHQLQTKFGILDRLYPTGELNVIPNSNRKRNKILPGVSAHQNAESEIEMQQTTLSQYENIAPVVNRLQGLRNRSHRGKKGNKTNMSALLFSHQNSKPINSIQPD